MFLFVCLTSISFNLVSDSLYIIIWIKLNKTKYYIKFHISKLALLDLLDFLEVLYYLELFFFLLDSLDYSYESEFSYNTFKEAWIDFSKSSESSE
jgi:hypothetical protein